MIAVRLQTENGKAQCPEDIGIDFVLPTGDAAYPLLQYVDPYGDTIFNQLQMKQFLVDWEELRSAGIASASEQSWSAVRELARTCESEPHLYLRFIGD